MLVSDATRTRETARTLLDSWRAQGFTLPGNVKITPDGYLASAEDWMDLASTVDVGYSALWIIGHNPGISDLVTVLTGDYLAMATADIVHVGIRGHSWSECGPGAGQILSHSPGRGL